MAGVTGRAVTQISTDEDVANANNPQHAAKGLAEGGDSREEDDDDLRNRNANKSSNIEVRGLDNEEKCYVDRSGQIDDKNLGTWNNVWLMCSYLSL